MASIDFNGYYFVNLVAPSELKVSLLSSVDYKWINDSDKQSAVK